MDRLFVEEELFDRLRWFVAVRWTFISSLILTVIAARVLRIDLPYLKILEVGGFIFAYNLALYLRHLLAAQEAKNDARKTRIEANFQIWADYISLTAVIHFTGGVENPFIFLYLLHVIIGSIILRRSQAWAHGLLAYLLFLAMVVLEYAGIIPHYMLKGVFLTPQHQNLWFIAAVACALLVTLLCSIYMSSSIVRSLRSREYDLMQARSVLQKKSQDLENANRELRTKQMQLVQSEKLASLGQLSAGMAHEINNPIQFIQGNLRIVSEAIDTILPILDRHADANPDLRIARLDYPFFREHICTLLSDMSRGAVRIAAIVKDLKKFARADEDSLDEMVDVNDVIQSSLRLVYHRIKHQQVVTELDPDLPKIKGNANKLEQVMVANLINAAEALGDRPSGVIKIATSLDSGTTSITVTISDSGPGMTEEVKRKLFDPFFSTKQRSGGMGLGLSIAYGIIKEHNGWIDVETNLGEGTTFQYHLPLARNKE